MKARRTKRFLTAFVGVLFLLTMAPLAGYAEVPQSINYQGYLAGSDGNPVPDDDYLMGFSIYDVLTGGDSLWSVSHTLTVTNGIYNVILGQPGNLLDPDIFDGDLYLGVTVDTDAEMTPRQRLTSTPFAMKAAGAEDADTLEGYAAVDFVRQGQADSVTTGMIANSTITSDDLGAGSVGSSEIATGSVGTSEIATGAVGSSEIATGAVATSDIANDAVNMSKIADSSVGMWQIAGGAVTMDKIAWDAVGTNQIENGSVTAKDLQDGAALTEILDDDGPGSGLNADLLDGHDSSYFMNSGTDYGRSGVSANLYEGTSALTNKYVNESGDTISGNTTGWLFDVTNSGTGFGIDSSAQSLALRGTASSSSGTGVRGNASGTSGHGVYGYASGNTGYGVYGVAVSTGDYLNYGGHFSAAGEDGRGVYGYASKTGDVTNYGGYFRAQGNSGRAIYGYARGTNGYGLETNASKYGVYARAYNSTGIGVAGFAMDNGNGQNKGGHFLAYGSQGRGVYGWAANTGDVENYGGWFQASGQDGRGVYGYASNSGTTTNYGGYFSAAGTTARAVRGSATNSGDVYNYGGYFEAAGKYGRAVYGYASDSGTGSGTNYGVYGYARGNTGRGVYGYASYTGTGSNYGVYGDAKSTAGRGVYGTASGSDAYAGYFYASGTNGTGIYARGKEWAGDFRGNVRIRNHDTGVTIMELGEGLDYAEGFDVSDRATIDSGSVLIIDPDNPGKLTLSNSPYDTKVAGIAAGANGLGSGVRLGGEQFDQDVALAGRVFCNVDATEAGVEPGDMLTTSSTPGHAMKSTDYARAHGAILGKAMQRLEKGQKGQILVLVTLQ